MVEYGWAITKADLDEINETIRKKNLNSNFTDLLLKKFGQILNNIKT